jgi:hypothetical protein
MLRSVHCIRYLSPFAVVLPFVLGTSACTDSGNDAGSGGFGGAGASTGTKSSDDTTAPKVTSTVPEDGATGASTIGPITATFDEAMAPSSVDKTSFQIFQGAAAVPGEVTYFNDTASFSPEVALALGAEYTATISTAVTDVAGNAIAAKYSWKFTTDATAPVGPAPVILGAAGKYAVLAKSEISNVPTSAITGDVGLSPAAASYITGFGLTKAGTKWTSPQVTGSIFSADGDPPTPNDLTTAISNMQTAYTDAATRPLPTYLDLGAGAIGGMTLAPGLYRWNSSVTVPTDVTIAGAPNDVWIFQITGDLKVSAAKAVTLAGGARAKNIVWQVAGYVDLGTTSHTEGIVLSKTAIKMGTGSSIDGRLFAQTAINLAGATVTVPSP